MTIRAIVVSGVLYVVARDKIIEALNSNLKALQNTQLDTFINFICDLSAELQQNNHDDHLSW